MERGHVRAYCIRPHPTPEELSTCRAGPSWPLAKNQPSRIAYHAPCKTQDASAWRTTMSDDVARMLYEGAVAVREGRRADAQGLLLQVIERDEQNEQAWLWLSGAVEDPADQQVALENVLAINPSNTAAREGLTWLKQRYGDLAVGAAPGGEWVPPPPLPADYVAELACWQCG